MPVKVQVTGVSESIKFIRRKGKDINDGVDLGTFQAAVSVKEEVQESIKGRKVEPRSVATGLMGNSIEVDKLGEGVYKIFPRKKFYPGTKTTTDKVATLLEFGTRHISARMHFRNSMARKKQDVIATIKRAIKNQLRFGV